MTACGQFAPRHKKIEGEEEDTDSEHHFGEKPAEIIQLFLQGGLLLFCGGDHAGDLAHFGGHPGCGDDGFAAPVDDGGAHIAHIFPVAERDIRLLLRGSERFQHLIDRHGFAGKGGFLDFQGGAFQDPPVGRDGVAGFQQNDIAGDKVDRRQNDRFPIAQDLTGGGRHALQSLDRRFGLLLLDHAEESVEQNDNQNDDRFRPFALP